MQSSISIWRIPTPEFLRPMESPFRYPSYSKDWGVEQDFDQFICKSSFIAADPKSASHHYLPIYWTRYWLLNSYATFGKNELESYIKSISIDESKLFTVCQYDDGPLCELRFGKGLFLASRKNPSIGIDIPLLASRIPTLPYRPKKRYLMSFAGRFDTHPIREELRKQCTNNIDIFVSTKRLHVLAYARLLQQSYVALCPRGYGGSSFRFFEAMQLGVVPCLIGDIDTRPFKEEIDWAAVSFYFQDPKEAITAIQSIEKSELARMGRLAKRIYESKLCFPNWNWSVLNKLV